MTEELQALLDLLRDWSDRYGGSCRVELVPISKYTNERLISDDADIPRIDPNTLVCELERAVESATFCDKLTSILREAKDS